jgi:elongation factor P
MINVTDLRPGQTFTENGEPLVVLKYEHIKMGRGTASIAVKVKNLKNGQVIERSYISGARVEDIATDRRKLQYLYKSEDKFCFMDPKSYEQVEISEKLVAEQAPYLKEQETIEVVFWDQTPLFIVLPPKMTFTIADTGPSTKGNTAANIYKAATLDNGLDIKVPLFIENGDKVIVDTRNGTYVERVK